MTPEIATIARKRRDELAAITPSRSTWTAITEWHARTRPLISKHFATDLGAFDQILKVRWVAYPRVIAAAGRRVDNSRTDAAERSGNEKVVQAAYAKLLAHVDAIIELIGVDDSNFNETTESDSVFSEIENLIDQSLLPTQYKTVVLNDLLEARRSYRASAYKSCVVMLGAALEGVMLGTLVRSDVIAGFSLSASPPGPIRRLGNRNPLLADKIGRDLGFEDYKVCIHELIDGSDALGVDNVQSFRNAIHPWKSIQEPLKYGAFDRARAIHYLGSFKKILDALVVWTP
ncbi:hypothetical protein [Roseimaritima ulvae]|uniref:Uncharacterized protein n=1 Tax=Roseimaritima ulvae TaxID=980254 RepID=A0A5B9QZD7_9BACT|nr:hypothetical protein [Roseimaritima ulvae]QEG43442.1 hypothetical protein UC8_54910 [Roseimaritima ulvae]